MDQGAEAKVMLPEQNWEVAYQMIKDRLKKDEMWYDIKIHEWEREDSQQFEQYGERESHEPILSTAKRLRDHVREFLQVWEQIDMEHRAVAKDRERVTAFLDKFQKWMDRYGPMLETEYAQLEKVK